MPGKKPLHYFFDYLLKSPTTCYTATGAALFIAADLDRVSGYSLYSVYQGGDFVKVYVTSEDSDDVTVKLTEEKVELFTSSDFEESIATFSYKDVRYVGGIDGRLLSLIERACGNFFPSW